MEFPGYILDMVGLYDVGREIEFEHNDRGVVLGELWREHGEPVYLVVCPVPRSSILGVNPIEETFYDKGLPLMREFANDPVWDDTEDDES